MPLITHATRYKRIQALAYQTHIDSLLRQTVTGFQVATAIGAWPPERPWADFAPNDAEINHAYNLSQAYREVVSRLDPRHEFKSTEAFSNYRLLYRPVIGVMQFVYNDEFVTRLPAHFSINDPESIIAADEISRELGSLTVLWRLGRKTIEFFPSVKPEGANRHVNCTKCLDFGFDSVRERGCGTGYADRGNHATRLVAS